MVRIYIYNVGLESSRGDEGRGKREEGRGKMEEDTRFKKFGLGYT